MMVAKTISFDIRMCTCTFLVRIISYLHSDLNKLHSHFLTKFTWYVTLFMNGYICVYLYVRVCKYSDFFFSNQTITSIQVNRPPQLSVPYLLTLSRALGKMTQWGEAFTCVTLKFDNASGVQMQTMMCVLVPPETYHQRWKEYIITEIYAL